MKLNEVFETYGFEEGIAMGQPWNPYKRKWPILIWIIAGIFLGFLFNIWLT